MVVVHSNIVGHLGKEAIKKAGGIPVAGGLVAPEVLQELEEELEMAKQHAG